MSAGKKKPPIRIAPAQRILQTSRIEDSGLSQGEKDGKEKGRKGELPQESAACADQGGAEKTGVVKNRRSPGADGT